MPAVRHASQEDLDRVSALLVELRKLPQLRERRPGYFSFGGRAFLHFHEDAGDLYVDVRFSERFERLRVTDSKDQTELLLRVMTAVQAGPRRR